jgi:hypothetical protein
LSWDFPLSALEIAAAPVETDVSDSSNGAAQAISATLPGVAGKTTYISGFEVTGSGATVGLVVLVTLSGVVGGPLTYVLPIVAGALLAITPLIVNFARPIPASGPDVDITVSVPSFGLGNMHAAVVVHGYQA